MSKTGAIFLKVNSIDFKTYEKIIKDLLEIGWSINKKGKVFFMINESYEWQALPVDDYPTVIKLVEKSVNNNHATCIDLSRNDVSASIGLNFLDNKTVMISISEELKMINSLPVLDFSWYLERIFNGFNSIIIDSIECSYG